jgi:hypothetical protein
MKFDEISEKSWNEIDRIKSETIFNFIYRSNIIEILVEENYLNELNKIYEAVLNSKFSIYFNNNDLWNGIESKEITNVINEFIENTFENSSWFCGNLEQLEVFTNEFQQTNSNLIENISKKGLNPKLINEDFILKQIAANEYNNLTNLVKKDDSIFSNLKNNIIPIYK